MTQSASSVILIRPTGFGYDPETADSNAFQQRSSGPEVQRQAAVEFDALLEALRQSGVGTTVLEPVAPAAPNAVFPNNWFSTHEDGTVVLYPMLTPSRRVERDPDIVGTLSREGFRVRQVIDHTAWEQQGRMLEGTGSLVLDRVHNMAFACTSPRTHEQALRDWCEEHGYMAVPFTATMDGSLAGQPVYHTNVVMSIGSRFAVVCFEAMPYPGERAEVARDLERSGRLVVPITLEQMHRYVGNMLELRSQPASSTAFEERAVIFLSRTAFEALLPDQRQALQRHAQLVPVPIPTIEAVGGGSIRCMLAENFLGRR
jgi:hypothetical protein